MNGRELLRARATAHQVQDQKDGQALVALGWRHSSDYPGASWYWAKDFPDSAARPAFAIAGASLGSAIAIEAAFEAEGGRRPAGIADAPTEPGAACPGATAGRPVPSLRDEFAWAYVLWIHGAQFAEATIRKWVEEDLAAAKGGSWGQLFQVGQSLADAMIAGPLATQSNAPSILFPDHPRMIVGSAEAT